MSDYDVAAFVGVVAQSADDEPGGYTIRGIRRWRYEDRVDDNVERMIDRMERDAE